MRIKSEEELRDELTELKFKIEQIKKQLKIFWKAKNSDDSFNAINKIEDIIGGKEWI